MCSWIAGILLPTQAPCQNQTRRPGEHATDTRGENNADVPMPAALDSALACSHCDMFARSIQLRHEANRQRHATITSHAS